MVAAVTAISILLFQSYWVYNTYRNGKENFEKLLTSALQHSVDQYLIQQAVLPSTLSEQVPTLNVLEMKKDNAPAKNARSGKNRGVTIMFKPVEIDKNDLGRVKLMMAQLISKGDNKPVDLVLLTKIFREELGKINVRLPFKLIVLKHQQPLPADKVASYVNFSKSSPIVIADISGTSNKVLQQNLIPAMVSLLLILLSAGSLFYMWIIIRKQIKLNDIKNDFIGNVTHEFRTPLSILKSTHEALINFGEVSDTEKTIRYLQINKGILDKLDKNVDRILDISQFESGARLANLELIRIDELIADVIKRFTLRDGAEIYFKNQDNLGEVITDGYIIDTIVNNLIDNAIKYAREKVVVNLEITRTKNGWQLMISDNGIGIGTAHLPFVFDKFYRVPSGDIHDVKGYGLGLSYVRQLVGSLDGAISVKSKLNSGTTFTIQFSRDEHD